MKKIVIALITAYQCLSSILKWFLGGQQCACCRFTPTCSQYAREAIEQHGTLIGTFLILKRVARCHPFGGWGYDPVPVLADKKSQGAHRG